VQRGRNPLPREPLPSNPSNVSFAAAAQSNLNDCALDQRRHAVAQTTRCTHVFGSGHLLELSSAGISPPQFECESHADPHVGPMLRRLALDLRGERAFQFVEVERLLKVSYGPRFAQCSLYFASSSP
jgi:hypothetical protein